VDAAKGEDVLKKAMAEAQAQVAKANDEQRPLLKPSCRNYKPSLVRPRL